MAIEAGAQVTPEITLVEPLDEGAMGKVWVADHAKLGQRIAVKFVAPELAANARVLARFRREAAAATQLHSPHTVRSFEHGLSRDGLPYIAMELLEGESLGARLARVGRLDLEPAGIVIRHVAASLAEAHAHGIVHRDVKAENVFLTESAAGLCAKVLDFGMAKQMLERAGSVVTATGVVVGTPEYMSPEQVLGSKQLDHRTDLWSLGVLGYRAMTGEMPFRGATPHAMVFAICKAEYARPSSLGLPVALDSWFERALAPQLDRRFSSAAELVEALELALDPAVTASRPKTTAAKEMEDADTLLVSAATLAAARARVNRGAPARDEPPTPSGGAATVALEDQPPDVPEPPDSPHPPRRRAEGSPVPIGLPQSTGEATVALEQPEPARPAGRLRRWLVAAAILAVGAVALVALGGRFGGEGSDPSAASERDVGVADRPAATDATGDARAAKAHAGGPSSADEGSDRSGARPAIDLDNEWADGTGRLSIECAPRCDDIRIGERSLGASPLEGVELPAGEHLLALYSAERPTTYVRVLVTEGQEVRRQISLAAEPSAKADATSLAAPATAETAAPALTTSGRFEPSEL